MPKLSEILAQGQPQPSAPVKLSDVAATARPAADAPARLPGVLGTINDFGNDLGDAFVHHLGNIPVGLAQLAAHGVVDRVAPLVPEQERSLSSLITGKAPEPSGLGDRLRQFARDEYGMARKAVDGLDQYAAKREAAYQASVPDSAGSYTGAALGEILPWATGLGEARAAGVIPTATTTAGKLAALGGEGLTMAAAQPVTEGDFDKTKLGQVIVGTLAGPVLHGLGKGASALGKGAKDALQYVRDPQAVADRYVKALFGGDDPQATARMLANAPEYVGGDLPTAAQAIASQSPSDAQSIGAVAAERVLRNNPATKEALAVADAQNNRARQSVVQRLAGSDEQMDAAKQARREAIAPFVAQYLTDSRPITRWTGAREAFKGVLDNPAKLPAADFDAIKQADAIVSKVRGGSLQEDDALEALRELGDSVTTQKAQDAFAAATQAINRNMVDPSGVLRAIATVRNGPLGVDPRRGADLDAITASIERARNINGHVGTDMLDQVRQQAGKLLGNASDQSALAYGPARDEIANAIEQVAPGYLDYLATYARQSEPINTMESVRALADPNGPGGLNAVGDPQLLASRLKAALRGDDRARYPMSDAARTELEALRSSLAREGISANKIAASGSNTAADLQAQSALARGLFGSPLSDKPGLLARAGSSSLGAAIGTMLGHPVLGAAAGGLIPDALQKVNQRVASRIGSTAANSRLTSEAIQRALQAESSAGQPSLLGELLFGKTPERLPDAAVGSRLLAAPATR